MMAYGEASWGWMMAFGMLLFWGTITFVVIWAISRVTDSASNRAQTILEERFARGEIDEEELRRMSISLSG